MLQTCKNRVYGDLVINKESSTYRIIENFTLIGHLENSSYEIDGYIEVIDPKTLGQYTGLKDKNGVKIFEGDIVKCPVKMNQHLHGQHINRVVLWKDDSFTWVFDSPFSWGRFEDNMTDDGSYIKYNDEGVEILIEVIGNIHENKDLLP